MGASIDECSGETLSTGGRELHPNAGRKGTSETLSRCSVKAEGVSAGEQSESMDVPREGSPVGTVGSRAKIAQVGMAGEVSTGGKRKSTVEKSPLPDWNELPVMSSIRSIKRIPCQSTNVCGLRDSWMELTEKAVDGRERPGPRRVSVLADVVCTKKGGGEVRSIFGRVLESPARCETHPAEVR